MTVTVDGKDCNAAEAPLIQDIDELPALRHRYWLSTISRLLICPYQAVAFNSEAGDCPATGIYRKEKRMILTNSERSLRLQRICDAAAASSAGRKAAGGMEGSIVAQSKCENFVLGCVVCHCEYTLCG